MSSEPNLLSLGEKTLQAIRLVNKRLWQLDTKIGPGIYHLNLPSNTSKHPRTRKTEEETLIIPQSLHVLINYKERKINFVAFAELERQINLKYEIHAYLNSY